LLTIIQYFAAVSRVSRPIILSACTRDFGDTGRAENTPESFRTELVDKYNAWLRKNVIPATLKEIRREAGVGSGDRVPQLAPDQFLQSSLERFRTEARFFLDVEKRYIQRMRKLIKEERGVKALLIATSDYEDRYAGYAHPSTHLALDGLDGHGYWNLPKHWDRPGAWVHTSRRYTTRWTRLSHSSRASVVGKPMTVWIPPR
jgi:hypothetical protein